MDQSDAQKRKPADKPRETGKPSPTRKAVQIAEEVVTDTLKTGEAPTLERMAQLHSIGLLIELAKLGEDLVGTRRAAGPAVGESQPVDPRKQLKPRSQVKPR